MNTVAVALAAVTWLWAMTGPEAEGPRVTRDGDGRVTTGIQTPGSPAGGVPGPARPASSRPQGSAGGPQPCQFRALTPEEALVAGLRSPDDGGVENLPGSGGTFMLRDCTASGGGRVVLWVPNGADSPAPAGAVLVTPAMLAQEARNTLQLPEPAVGVNPDGLNQNPALVNLPTWWWVTNGEALTQRTSLGGVWAEVTAEAVASTWTTSGGERTECAGLGMAWAPGMRELQPGSCSHTYTRADEDEQAQLEVVWRVSWVGSGGTEGTLEPFVMTASQAVPVYERHAIVTSSG